MKTENLFIVTLAARLGAWLNDVFAFRRRDDDPEAAEFSLWDDTDDWAEWESQQPS